MSFSWSLPSKSAMFFKHCSIYFFIRLILLLKASYRFSISYFISSILIKSLTFYPLASVSWLSFASTESFRVMTSHSILTIFPLYVASSYDFVDFIYSSILMRLFIWALSIYISLFLIIFLYYSSCFLFYAIIYNLIDANFWSFSTISFSNNST